MALVFLVVWFPFIRGLSLLFSMGMFQACYFLFPFGSLSLAQEGPTYIACPLGPVRLTRFTGLALTDSASFS